MAEEKEDDTFEPPTLWKRFVLYALFPMIYGMGVAGTVAYAWYRSGIDWAFILAVGCLCAFRLAGALKMSKLWRQQDEQLADLTRFVDSYEEVLVNQVESLNEALDAVLNEIHSESLPDDVMDKVHKARPN